MALKQRQRAAEWRQTTQRWVETATATEKSTNTIVPSLRIATLFPLRPNNLYFYLDSISSDDRPVFRRKSFKQNNDLCLQILSFKTAVMLGIQVLGIQLTLF